MSKSAALASVWRRPPESSRSGKNRTSLGIGMFWVRFFQGSLAVAHHGKAEKRPRRFSIAGMSDAGEGAQNLHECREGEWTLQNVGDDRYCKKREVFLES